MKTEKLLAILNNGTRDDLKALPRIGTYRANLLLANRPFDSLDAVENVKGITFNMLEMLSDAMPQEMTKFPEVRTEEVQPETDTIEDSEKLFNEIEEEGVDLGEQKPAPQKDPEGGLDLIRQTPQKSGSFWKSLIKGAITSIFAILVTLAVLGSINGSLRYIIKSDQASIQGEIDQLSLQIETYKEEIVSLRTRLGTLEGLGERTAELSTAQEQLTADLEETNEQMSTLLNDVTSLVERINLEEDRTERIENFFIDLNTLLKNLLVSQGE